jgi:hypothetical protein
MESFTVKEMVSQVLEQQRESLVVQTKMLQHAENTDNHLLQLNHQTEKNKNKITGLEQEHGKVRVIFGTLSVLLTGAWAFITLILK